MAAGDIVYDVMTNLDPNQLNQVGLEIFAKWTEFALGGLQLGGKRVLYPTGKYAASLHYRRYGMTRVAIIADEKYAPEARMLETGHRPVDLLQHLTPGRAYPMHRGWAMGVIMGKPGRRLWAKRRASGFTGFARVPHQRAPGKFNTSHTGPEWTIPAMPAYSPARILRDLVQAKFGV